MNEFQSNSKGEFHSNSSYSINSKNASRSLNNLKPPCPSDISNRLPNIVFTGMLCKSIK